jgi:hypothetical protein
MVYSSWPRNTSVLQDGLLFLAVNTAVSLDGLLFLARNTSVTGWFTLPGREYFCFMWWFTLPGQEYFCFIGWFTLSSQEYFAYLGFSRIRSGRSQENPEIPEVFPGQLISDIPDSWLETGITQHLPVQVAMLAHAGGASYSFYSQQDRQVLLSSLRGGDGRGLLVYYMISHC